MSGGELQQNTLQQMYMLQWRSFVVVLAGSSANGGYGFRPSVPLDATTL
jgi:hypothetical protein